MAERRPSGEHRRIAPKDVFERCNMPSRWERLTGVAPKTDPDRQYLSFLAACYRGEKRLPYPGTLVVPAEFGRHYCAQLFGRWTSAGAVIIVVTGLAIQQLVLAALAGAALVAAAVAMVQVWWETAPAIKEFNTLKSRCEATYARLCANSIDPRYRNTLNEMITCDEGTLAYCAAKIASEIYQDPAWKSDRLEVIAISLLDEVAEIA